MTRSILLSLIFFQAFFPSAISQKLRKADKEIISDLQTDITYLSSDKLEGRRSGTAGESLASDYIIAGFMKTGLKPMGDSGTYLQRFEIYDGRDISHTRFTINNAELILNTEYIPLAFSALGKVDGSPAVALQESGSPWFYDLKDAVESAASNPHFDMGKLLREKIRLFAGKGATAVIFYNSSKTEDGIVFRSRRRNKAGKNSRRFCHQNRKKKISERYFPITRCGDRSCDDGKKTMGS